MTKVELLKMIDDEVSQILREPIKEPGRKIVQKPTTKPSLQNEEEVDDYFFRAGKKKNEI